MTLFVSIQSPYHRSSFPNKVNPVLIDYLVRVTAMIRIELWIRIEAAWAPYDSFKQEVVFDVS